MQRKGIRDDIRDASSVYLHVELACQLPFFVAQRIPLPPALARAQDFVAFCDPNAVSPFWGKQLTKMQDLVSSSAKAEQVWNSCTPPEIAPAAGNLNITEVASLMKQANLGGAEWLKQFVNGFPLVGSLRQQHAYPFVKRSIKASLLSQNQLLTDSGVRFSERAKKSGHKNGPPLWEEATQQCRDGWLTSLSRSALPLLLSRYSQLPAILHSVSERPSRGSFAHVVIYVARSRT